MKGEMRRRHKKEDDEAMRVELLVYDSFVFDLVVGIVRGRSEEFCHVWEKKKLARFAVPARCTAPSPHLQACR